MCLILYWKPWVKAYLLHFILRIYKAYFLIACTQLIRSIKLEGDDKESQLSLLEEGESDG